jgi:hypothetical protein
MGKSKSVEDLIDDNEKNRVRLSELDAELETQEQAAIDKMEGQATEFYADNNWEFKNYLGGSQRDYQLSETWNLKNLADVIDGIGGAAIGGLGGVLTPPPEGTVLSSDSSELNEIGGITYDTRLMIASNCLRILTSTLQSFGNTTAIGLKDADDTTPLGQGLRIFTSVTSITSQEDGFFDSKVLNSYRFSYRVYFSLDEFKQQALQSLLAQYNSTAEVYVLQGDRVAEQFKNQEINFEQYLALAAQVTLVHEELTKKIQELESEELKNTYYIIQLRNGIDLAGQFIKAMGEDLVNTIDLRRIVENNKSILNSIKSS